MQTIAIVGMACRYPDARSPQELWENALAQRQAFRTIPDKRLNLNDYYHPDRNMPDRTYSTQGAFLTDYAFDRERFRISGRTYRSTDLTHWLALDIAEQALTDAGFFKDHELPTSSTGVIVGNTLTGEFSRSQVLRLRWPYVSRVVTQELLHENWQPDAIQNFLNRLEKEYKKPFAPVNEETLAGGLSNTIAGRICNYFDLHGGGYTVDGACSSSLLAITHACRSLESFDIKVALAGGVDLSIDPFEIIGFAKTAALATDEMRVYDLHSHGFLPGEGCGFIVLMRYEDALAENYHIHALIRGWGISSDGNGGITRPRVEGQHMALMQAYQRSKLNIDTIPYIEGHGTGTQVGDETELKAIAFTWDQMKNLTPEKQTSISTIKANIGHTKAAAGIAGVIKATMALSNQIIPPTSGMREPHNELTRPGARLKVLKKGKLWPEDTPLVAGISAMGFGGINTHIVLEGNTGEKRRDRLTDFEQKLLTSHQDAEIFLLRASSSQDMLEQVSQLLSLVPHFSYAELADFSAYLASHLQVGTLRAALIASKPHEFEHKLQQLQKIVASGVTTHLDPRQHIYLDCRTDVPRISFLFPGQGSPAHLNGGMLRSNFSEIDALYREANLPEDADGKQTEIAQPAITLASLAGLKVMEKLGIQAQVAIGHSLGELTALHWADVIDAPALSRIARARGKAMSQLSNEKGTMLSLKANAQIANNLIQNEPVVISGFNSPYQTIIAGDTASIHKISARAYAQGIPCVQLAVSNAFHSPLVAPAADVLAAYLDQEHFSVPRRSIVSTVTGNIIKDDHIKALLYQQVTAPVRFLEAVEHIHEETDLFIEVGPGHTLQRLLSDITSKPAVSTDAGSPSIRGILSVAAAAFVMGAPLTISELFAHRFMRPIDLNWNPSFLINPCEEAPFNSIEHSDDLPENFRNPADIIYSSDNTTFGLLQKIISVRTEMPPYTLLPESRMLSDLHLNSISVGEIFAEACRTLEITQKGLLLKYADATLSEIVAAFEDLQRQGSSSHGQANEMSSLAPWIRCFTITEQEQPLTRLPQEHQKGDWQIFAPLDYPFTKDLAHIFAMIKGVGCIVCLPEDLESCYVELLFQAAQAMIANQTMTNFVLIQHGSVGAAFARSVYLEHPRLKVCVIHLPTNQPSFVDIIATEVQTVRGFVEVSYDAEGRRTQPELMLYKPAMQGQPLTLDANDVLLVTGGGKGIAAECALLLAQDTGVTLALLGRAHPQSDPVLQEHLTKLDAAGVRYRYFSVNIQNADAVKDVIHNIETALGQVTAILHGAGINQPALLSMLNEETINQTIATKVQGLQNILAVVASQKIKSLITFGSIIARTGMQGEAHYALANEWLGHITTTFQRENPDSNCLCIEWSVWSEVGMGRRLGRVDMLRAEGITPIPVAEGLSLFRQLSTQRQSANRIIVSGRVGGAPTLTMATSLPFLRFLEKPQVFYPGIELVADAEMSRTMDSYVDDHQLQGERLVPAVIGLEAMAQAAQAVTGNQSRPSFSDVQFIHPFIIPEQGSVTMRVMALVHHDGAIEVAIRCSTTNYQFNHFQATCRFDTKSEDLTPLLQWNEMQDAALQSPRPDDLYNEILFHRGRFRRVQCYTYLHTWGCIANITPYADGAWFAHYLSQELVLGDPASRDAFIHTIQACIPQITLLPVRVESICFSQQPPSPKQQIQVYARERSRQGNTFIYDMEARNSDGQLIEQWNGLHLYMVGDALPHEQLPPTLLGPYLERRISELSPQMQQIFLTMHTTADETSLALQHSDRMYYNLHIVRRNSNKLWQLLLSTHEYVSAQQLSAQNHEDFDTAATRVLAVSELLKRSGLSLDEPLVQIRAERDGWQIMEAGPHLFLTFVMHIRSQPQPTVFAFHQQVTNMEQSVSILGVEGGSQL